MTWDLAGCESFCEGRTVVLARLGVTVHVESGRVGKLSARVPSASSHGVVFLRVEVSAIWVVSVSVMVVSGLSGLSFHGYAARRQVLSHARVRRQTLVLRLSCTVWCCVDLAG